MSKITHSQFTPSTDKPATPVLPTDPKPGQKPDFPRWKWLSFLLTSAFFLYLALHWADVVEWVDEQWRLKPKRKTEMERQLRRIDDAVQYALVANRAKYYGCYLCPTGKFFLHPNEAWRYGVTYMGEQGRYPGQLLDENDLRFVIQFKGTYSECLKEEKRKLFAYPLLLENVIRPDSLKLLLPPGNTQTR